MSTEPTLQRSLGELDFHGTKICYRETSHLPQREVTNTVSPLGTVKVLEQNSVVSSENRVCAKTLRVGPTGHQDPGRLQFTMRIKLAAEISTIGHSGTYMKHIITERRRR